MRTPFLLLGLILSASSVGAAPPESGLNPGDRPGPYSFLVCTGPQRGQPTCYVCDTAEKPMVILFARELTGPLGKLAAKVDQAVTAQRVKDLRGWMTLTAKGEGWDEKLVAFARKNGLKSLPVGLFDDVDGPPAYKLNRDAQVTVVVAIRRKAVKSFAYRAGELNDQAIDDIVKAVAALK